MKQSSWAGVVYVLTNTVNGMCYVGKTEKDPEKRWDSHIKAAERVRPKHYLHRAIRKYGVEKFTAEVVQRCRTAETLNAAEKRWVRKLDSMAPGGYNMTAGGDGVVGGKHSTASRKKISAASIRWFADQANHAKFLTAVQSEACRMKMSVSQKAYRASLTRKEREAFSRLMSKVNLKRFADPASRAAMRAGQVRRFADPVKLASHRNACRDEKFRAAQAERSRAKWRTPQYREIWMAANATDEVRRRRSESAKRYHADPVKHANQVAAAQSPTAKRRQHESMAAWYADPKNRARHCKLHRTAEFRAKKAENTRAFWAAMTPAERSAYWRKIHHQTTV